MHNKFGLCATFPKKCAGITEDRAPDVSRLTLWWTSRKVGFVCGLKSLTERIQKELFHCFLLNGLEQPAKFASINRI